MTSPRFNQTGSFSKKSEGKHAPLRKVKFAIPERLTNGSSLHRSYVPPHQQVREGGQDALQIKSRGFAC